VIGVATAQYVQVGDRKIAYEDPRAGSAEAPLPVILIHGSSFDRRSWDGVLPALARRYRPIAYDNPGHGGSGLPALESVDDAVALLHELIHALGLGQVVLAGHSMGGAVVQRYLQLHRDGVLAAALVSTAPNFCLPAELVEHWLGDPVAYRAEEAAMIVAPECPAATRELLAGMRADVTEEGQRSDLLSCAAWDNQRYLEIDVPTLLVTAQHDTPLFREKAAEWSEALGELATLETVPDAGHLMLVEQPARTAEVIVRWLSGLDAVIQG
jgi:3-oxoadipate enol-lactonase